MRTAFRFMQKYWYEFSYFFFKYSTFYSLTNLSSGETSRPIQLRPLGLLLDNNVRIIYNMRHVE
jgi:hypothetical protein